MVNALYIRWVTYDLVFRLTPKLGEIALLSCSVLLAAFNRTPKALSLALKAHRLTNGKLALFVLQRLLARNGPTSLLQVVSPAKSFEEVAKRTLVLQWPTIENNAVSSRGVLLIKFTTSFSYFLRNIDISRLETYFHLVLEPSWAGYADADILAWDTKTSSPVFVQAAEQKDRATLSSLCKNLVPINRGSGSWVDYRKFRAGDSTKRQFDSIYIANTNPIKRVHIYLRAIQKLKNAGHSNYRGALVCASWGGIDELQLRKLIRSLDIEDQCILYFSISQTRVAELVADSKTCILLSLKEGSNRSLYEAMFCDTPVLLLAENTGVDKANINEFTGLLIYENALPRTLLEMTERWRSFTPRAWAMNHLAPEVTTAELSSIIATHAGQKSATSSLLVKVNAPEAKYRDWPELKTEEFSGPLLEGFDLHTPHAGATEAILSLKNGFHNATTLIRRPDHDDSPPVTDQHWSGAAEADDRF